MQFCSEMEHVFFSGEFASRLCAVSSVRSILRGCETGDFSPPIVSPCLLFRFCIPCLLLHDPRSSTTMLFLVLLSSLVMVASARHHKEIRSSISAASTATGAGSLAGPSPPAIPSVIDTTSTSNSIITGSGSGSCFPFSGTLASDFSAPSGSRSDWWCTQSDIYGFLGFSYPLEVADCRDSSNSYESVNKDFVKMKKDFGASMVRVYAPECRQASVWENLLRAGVSNNMGIIVQV